MSAKRFETGFSAAEVEMKEQYERVVLVAIVTLLWMADTGARSPDTLWTKTYGELNVNRGNSVQQTKDGGYVIAGTTYSLDGGRCDVYLVRVDASGNTLWSRTYGGDGWDYGYCVEQTADNGYIVTGCTYLFDVGRYDVYLLKTDAQGNDEWSKTYGSQGCDHGYSGHQTSDGGYIIAGCKHLSEAGHEHIYLLKTDPEGDTIWTRTLGGDVCAHGYAVEQTTDGGYIVAGSYDVTPDVYLVRTDCEGDAIWARTYGGAHSDCGYSVRQSSDGGYVVVGSTDSFGAGTEDVYLIRTDPDGNTLWTRTYGGAGSDYGYSVEETSDGGYIIAGSYDSSGAVDYDVYLIKTDARGDTLWTRTYGGPGLDDGYAVQQTSDGGYIIAGCTGSFGEGYSVWLIKLGP